MSAFYMGVIVPSVVVLPITVALVQHKYWKTPERLSFFYLILSGVFNVIAKVTAIRHINNLPLLHLYTVLEFCLLAAVFHSFFADRRMKNILLALIIIFPVAATSYIFYTHSLHAYNTVFRFLGSVILMCFSLVFIISDLDDSPTNYSVFSFGVVIGLMLYFSSASALFGLSEYIRPNKALNTVLWNIHATLVMIMYLFFAVAYLKIDKKR